MERALQEPLPPHHLAVLEQAPHAQLQIAHGEGLFEVIAGAAAEGGDRGVEARIRGHQDDRRPRVEQPRLVQHVEAAEARHHEVGDDDVELLLLEAGHGLLAAPGCGDPISLGRERLAQHLPHGGQVVHDENRGGHDSASWRGGAALDGEA